MIIPRALFLLVALVMLSIWRQHDRGTRSRLVFRLVNNSWHFLLPAARDHLGLPADDDLDAEEPRDVVLELVDGQGDRLTLARRLKSPASPLLVAIWDHATCSLNAVYLDRQSAWRLRGELVDWLNDERSTR